MEQSPRLALWAGFGLLAGFAGLTEPSVLVVIPFLLVLACWRLRRDGKRWLLPGCVACVVMVAAISPWMIRNALVFHRFIPMRDSMGLELWMGNNGYDLRWTSDDLHPLHDAQELAAYNSMGELAYMHWKTQQAKAYIHDHPGWYAWMSLRRAVYIWTGYWSFDRDYLALEPMDPANIPFATCLTLLGLLGIMMAWRDTPFEVIRYAGVLFLFPIIYYFSHPEPYHLRPVDPVMVILGCQAILMLRERSEGSAEVSGGHANCRHRRRPGFGDGLGRGSRDVSTADTVSVIYGFCDRRIQHRRCLSRDGSVRRAIEIENNHFVRSRMQPRARHIKRLLRSDVPYASQRVAVHPHHSLHEIAGVEKSVAGMVHLQCAAIEARARAIGRAERQLLRIAHRQRINLPTRQRLACQCHLLRNSLALAAYLRAEVDTA